MSEKLNLLKEHGFVKRNFHFKRIEIAIKVREELASPKFKKKTSALILFVCECYL